jgi:hypothetical protein
MDPALSRSQSKRSPVRQRWKTLVAFDVWHRSFGVLPLSDRKPDAPPLMVAGVLSHVAERCIALDGYADHAAGSGMPSTVGAVF